MSKSKNIEMIPCPEGMPFNEYMILLAEGGFVYKPNSGYGKILFVNKQNRIPIAQLHKAEKGINGKINIVGHDGNYPCPICNGRTRTEKCELEYYIALLYYQ